MFTKRTSCRKSDLDAVVKSIYRVPDDKVCLRRNLVGRLTARDAYAAQVERMIPHDRGLARLGFSKGDMEAFREREKGLMRFRVLHAAPADQKGFF